MSGKSSTFDLDFTGDLTGTHSDHPKGSVYAHGGRNDSGDCSPDAPNPTAPAKQLARKISFFVFYQEQGYWLWQRRDASEDVLASSSEKFMLYSKCVSDARRNGWRGKPLELFLPQKRRK